MVKVGGLSGVVRFLVFGRIRGRPVAQLVRARSLYLRGRWFESTPAYTCVVVIFLNKVYGI